MLLAELNYFICSQVTIMTWNENILLLNNMRQGDRSLAPKNSVGFFENYFSLLNDIVMMNSVQSTFCWKASNKFSWNNFYFISIKEFWHGKRNIRDILKNIRDFLKNFFEYYFFKIIVSINSYYDLNITEYYPEILTWTSLK